MEKQSLSLSKIITVKQISGGDVFKTVQCFQFRQIAVNIHAIGGEVEFFRRKVTVGKHFCRSEQTRLPHFRTSTTLTSQKLFTNKVNTYFNNCNVTFVGAGADKTFIENAIIHGFKEIEGGGRLRVDIDCSEDKEFLLITIEHNGKGLPKEMVAQYNNVEWAINCQNGSIGLHNAFSRMYMYYSDKASWKITSIEEMGTVIMLKLPRL